MKMMIRYRMYSACSAMLDWAHEESYILSEWFDTRAGRAYKKKYPPKRYPAPTEEIVKQLHSIRDEQYSKNIHTMIWKDGPSMMSRFKIKEGKDD